MLVLNPCELEIDLFCKGCRISPNARESIRLSRRTRAGLGSGLEMVIPGKPKDIWVNVPVLEAFAGQSPYLLRVEKEEYYLDHQQAGLTYSVQVPAEPDWYRNRTTSGRAMTQVGVLQGTYLGVYIGPVCSFWKAKKKESCSFCTTGLYQEQDQSWRKTVTDVVETCVAARRESGITMVHFNSGYQEGRDLALAKPYVEAVKRSTGLMVGLQLAPVDDFRQYDELIDAGVDHFSFCVEFMNDFAFTRFCPGKARTLGKDAFFRAMEYTSSRLGKGRVSGEIIAGIEPIEDTLKAIDLITECGAFPTVCVFRPLQGSEMECYPAPFYEEMREVFRHVAERLVAYRIPVGIAPNIEVSLVVQPGDALYLASRNWNFLTYRVYNGILASILRPVFNRRLRKGDEQMERRAS